MKKIQYPLLRSSYIVNEEKDCVKVRNGSAESVLLQHINVKKIGYSDSLPSIQRDKNKIDAYYWLAKNRHIILMTYIEALMLIPYFDKYEINEIKGKRLFISCEIWHSLACIGGFTKKEMKDKINEVINAIELNNMIYYFIENGIIHTRPAILGDSEYIYNLNKNKNI